MTFKRLWRDYALMLIGAAVICVYGFAVAKLTERNVERRVRSEMAFEYAAELEKYKAEQAQLKQAEHWLSGDASRDAAVNQAVDAVAPVIARLKHDEQKLTEVGIMLARVMAPGFPNSFQEVAEQKEQWPLFDGTDKTYTEKDRELAETIIRPYMESGVVPLDLTKDFVFAMWTENDLVARDSFKTTATMKTWRYHG